MHSPVEYNSFGKDNYDNLNKIIKNNNSGSN